MKKTREKTERNKFGDEQNLIIRGNRTTFLFPTETEKYASPKRTYKEWVICICSKK
jgi:hypothetical protein